MIEGTIPQDYSDKQMKILQAAEKLFAGKGFAGTSVRDVASEAGVNVAMISYYFGSKEKLLESLFAHRIKDTAMMMEALLKDSNMTPFQKLEQLIDNYVNKIMSNQCFYRVMMREQLMQDLNHVSELIHTTKIRNMEIVKKLIQEGQRKNIFNKNIDVPMMMTLIVGTIQQAISTQNTYRIMNKMEDLPEDKFAEHLKKKLKHYLKFVLKAALTYEE